MLFSSSKNTVKNGLFYIDFSFSKIFLKFY